jgi:hypothetical protein
LVALAINNLHEARVKRQKLIQFSEMLMRKEDLQFLQDIESGTLTESEFILAVLLHLEILSDADVNPWKLVSEDNLFQLLWLNNSLSFFQTHIRSFSHSLEMLKRLISG